MQLVSRPIPQSTFRYRFDMVLDGHPLDRELQAALAEMREWTREVRIFGSYAGDRETTDARATLFEKIWDAARRRRAPGEPALLYVDLHLVHEVTSPQAFEALRLAGRRVRRPDLTIATMDHNVPTEPGPITRPAREGAARRARARTAPSSACR